MLVLSCSELNEVMYEWTCSVTLECGWARIVGDRRSVLPSAPAVPAHCGAALISSESPSLLMHSKCNLEYELYSYRTTDPGVQLTSRSISCDEAHAGRNPQTVSSVKGSSFTRTRKTENAISRTSMALKYPVRVVSVFFQRSSMRSSAVL